jgi:hypothetical protein
MNHEHNWTPWYQVAPLFTPVETWQKECVIPGCNVTSKVTRDINDNRGILVVAGI